MQKQGRKPATKRHAAGETETVRLRRELKEERALRLKAEKRISELEARLERMDRRLEALEEENRRLRDSRNQREKFLLSEINRLELVVKEKDEKLEEAHKEIAWLKKRLFGSSSEQEKPKTSAESPTEGGSESGTSKTAKSGSKKKRGQQPGSKGHPRSDRGIADADEETMEIPNCACSNCGKPYRKLNKSQDTEIHDIIVSLMKTVYHLSKYVSQCDCQGKRIVTAEGPAKLYPRCDIGVGLWEHLLSEKFLYSTPTNRTLKSLSLEGLHLPIGTITGGFKRINNYVEGLYNGIVTHCQGDDLWNADETTWKVFSSGRRQQWLWLIAGRDAAAYILDPSRSSKVPKNFFEGSKGTVMTDRFSSYKTLKKAIKKALCWVHVRRDFLNIFKGMPKKKGWAKKWLLMIAKLFMLTEKRFKIWQAGCGRGEAVQQATEDIVDHLQMMKWTFEEHLKSKRINRQQRKVLTSLKVHWTGLTLFVEDPRIPLHNNRAERLLRQAAILRKNSYGSGAEWSGEFAARLFSIYQTWLLNGLNPQTLMLDFLSECANNLGPPTDLKPYLPWAMSEERKAQFKVPKTYKLPA